MRAQSLALGGIAGPLLFTGLVILQGLLQPDYSHIRMPISALAAWPLGWIQILNFCMSGVLLIAFALGLHGTVAPTRRGGVGIGLLALGGLGIIVAGVFPWKMINGELTEPPAHVVGAIVAFASTGFGYVVFSRRLSADPAWRDLSPYALLVGVVVLALFVAVGFFAIEDGAPLHAWAGLLQRILCAVWFTFMIVLALRIRTTKLI